MSIEEIRKGNYKVRYRIGSKQFAKSGFRTKREAQAYEAEQKRRIRDHTWTDPNAGRISIEDVFSEWIGVINVSARTKCDYMEVWRNLISASWEHVEVRSATPSGIASWISEMNNRCSPARVSKACTILNQVFDWAVADQRITQNPVKRARLLSHTPLIHRKKTSSDVRFLSHREVKELVQRAETHGFMILLMAYTGLRFGEVTALQIRDIDLGIKRIGVVRAFSDISGKLFSVPPKSGKERQVPIPELLMGRLIEHLSRYVGSDPEQLVFTTSTGYPIRYSRWRRDVFNPAVAAAGLVGLTPHGLRHTYAVLAIQSGVNPKVLQSAMGHSDIRLTLDTYGGFFGDDLDALGQGLTKHFDATPVNSVPYLFPTEAKVNTTHLPKIQFQARKDTSRLGDSNSGPTHYECVALPLS
jgi:integrase